MDYADLQKLDDEALVHRELQLERDLITARFRKKTNQLENTALLSALRKDLARARTEQRVRERARGLGPNALRNRYRSSFRPGEAAPHAKKSEAGGGGFLKGIADRFGLGGKKDEAGGEQSE